MDWKEYREFSRAQEMAKKQMKQHELDVEREREARDRKPVSAVLISTNSKVKTGSALGRAVIGDMLMGVVGAFIGASTASSKNTATFSVKYASGRTGVETVDVKSARFRELSALLHD